MHNALDLFGRFLADEPYPSGIDRAHIAAVLIPVTRKNKLAVFDRKAAVAVDFEVHAERALSNDRKLMHIRVSVAYLEIAQSYISAIFNGYVSHLAVDNKNRISAVENKIRHAAEIERNGVEMRRFVGRKLLLPGGVGDNEHIFLAALAVDIISAAVEHGGLLPVLSFQCRDKLCEFLRNILIRDYAEIGGVKYFQSCPPKIHC